MPLEVRERTLGVQKLYRHAVTLVGLRLRIDLRLRPHQDVRQVSPGSLAGVRERTVLARCHTAHARNALQHWLGHVILNEARHARRSRARLQLDADLALIVEDLELEAAKLLGGAGPFGVGRGDRRAQRFDKQGDVLAALRAHALYRRDLPTLAGEEEVLQGRQLLHPGLGCCRRCRWVDG